MALNVKLPFGKTGTKIYTCRNCKFSTKYDVLYKMHTQRCSSSQSSMPRGPNVGQSIPRNYTCTSCAYKTSQSRLYLVHQVQEHKASYPIYPCAFCGYATRYRNKLIRHHTNIHLDRGVLLEKDVLPLDPPIEMKRVEADLIAKGFTVEADDDENKPLSKLKSKAKAPGSSQSSPSGSSKLSSSPNTAKSSEYIYEVPVDGMATTEFRCKLCTYKSPHRWSAMKHVRNMHINGKLYCCDKCNFSTAKKIEFSIHRAKHANQRMFNCKECEYETNQKSNLERHMANHTGRGPMKCELCSYSSTGGPAILRHMQEHHRGATPSAAFADGVAAAPQADAADSSDSADPEFIQMVDYEDFQKNTVDNDVYMEGNMDDNLINDDFLSPENFLPTDNPSSNSESETLPAEKSTKQLMKCPLCQLELPNERQLRNHILMHPKFQPWICPDCKCKYRRSSDLSRHLRKKHDRHISEYPRDSLMVLSIVKSDGKTIVTVKDEYNSDEDSSDFPATSGEQPLDLSVHPEKGARKGLFQPQFHKCKFCSYRAKWPADIRRHMSLSHRNRMAHGRFACTNCDRTYKYRSDLYVHMRKAHRIDTGKLKPVQPVQAETFTDPAVETDLGVSQLNDGQGLPVTMGESLLFSKPKKSAEKPKIIKDSSPNKHKCLYCDYIGNCKSEIDRHTLTHTGQKPFQCMFCDYKTIWKGDMKRHLPKHHSAEVEKSDIVTLLERTYRPELVAGNPDKETSEDPDMYNDSVSEFDTESDMMDVDEQPSKAPEPYTMEQLYGPAVFEAGIYEAGTVVVIPEAPDDAEAHAREQEQYAAQYNHYPELNDNPEYIDLEPDYDPIPGITDTIDTNSNSSFQKSIDIKSEPKYSGTQANDSNNNDDDEFLIDTDAETGKKTVYCPKCPFTCEAPSKMKSHVAIHENVKRFKCNYCGKRSNWLWDVRKHIKRDHPGDDYKNVTELSLDEARATLGEYLKKSGHRTIKSVIATKRKPVSDSPSQVSRNSVYYTNLSTGEHDSSFQCKEEQLSPNGFEGLDLSNPANYKKIPPHERCRPFKCSNCGKRSNWKHDMLKHIRAHHQGDGEVIILSLQEARESLEREMSSGQRSRSVTPSPSPMGTPSSSSKTPVVSPSLQAALTKRSPGGGMRCGGVKRFKCSECPYRSDYSSDIQRHIPRRHRGSQSATMVIMSYEEASESIDQYDYDWVKNRAKPGYGVDPRGTKSDEEVTKGKTYRCSKCEYRAKDRETVLQHLRTQHHNLSKLTSLKCKICTYTSAYRASVRRHLREAHKTTDYDRLIIKQYVRPAEDANNTGDSEGAPTKTKEFKVHVHSRVDPRSGRFQCALCGFLSPWKHSAERHIRNRHPDGNVERDLIMRNKVTKKPTVPPPKMRSPTAVNPEGYQIQNGLYYCNICPYKTKKIGLYRLHLSRHKPSPGNNRICKYCPFYTCNTRLLAQHVELHTNDPRGVWACSENKVSKPSSQDAKLGRHRSYFCEKCPYIGKNLSDFLYHKQFHRPRANAPYKCELCPYYASLKRIISQHKKVHDPSYKTHLKSIGRYPAGQNITMLEASPAKTDVSEGSYCNYDAVQMANLKQSIIMSKVRSVPISADSIKPHDVPMTPGSAMRDNKDPNLMYGCVVSKTGVVMNSSFYRKLHTCRFCPYTNARAANVKMHEKMHGPREGKDVNKCPYCDYHVGNKGLLSHHLKVHSQQYNPYRDEINDVEVDEDDASVKSGDSALSTSSEPAVPQTTTPQTTPVKLDPNRIPSNTGFYIKYDEKTGEHRLESIRFKKWCCERCPYATAKQSQFERHVKLHGSKQKYTCEYCDYSVPGYYLLMQHKNLHLYPNRNLLVTQSVSNLMKLPEVPADIAAAANFPTITDKADDETNLVHDHLALYENSDNFTEPKKLYRCDRCPYANVQRSHLLSHLKCHVIKNALQCPHCDYSVSKQHLLLQHIKIHFNHPDLKEATKEADETPNTEDDRPEEVKQKKEEDSSSVDSAGVQDEAMEVDEEAGEGNPAKRTKDGSSDQPRTSLEGNDADKKADKSELNNNNIKEEEDTLWICQYCDRAFAASEKLLQHEMQHLVL